MLGFVCLLVHTVNMLTHNCTRTRGHACAYNEMLLRGEEG